MDNDDAQRRSEDGDDAKNELATTTTANELINLDDLELSDEDTWLYTPPKTLSSEEKGLSPYKWLRQDIEDPNNKELQMAKTALVSKLDELDILKSVQKPLFFETKQRSNNVPDEGCAGKSQVESQVSNNCDKSEDLSVAENLKAEFNKIEATSNGVQQMISENKAIAEVKPLNDVTDVFERARQQEESLKQSSSRFFSQSVRTLPRSKGSMNCSASLASPRLIKPASVEALHMVGARSSSAASPTTVVLHPKTVISSPNVSPYSSMVSLDFSSDNHRSSLPNLTQAQQRSLKSRKSRRSSEQKKQCPLPMYPKSPVNSGMNGATQALVTKSSMHLLPPGCRESQTLPSSFRNKSRRSLNDVVSCAALSRRDSDPPPTNLCQKNSLKAHVARRESMPTGLNLGRNNSRNALSSFNQAPHREYAPLLKLNGSRSGSMNPLMPEELKEIPMKGAFDSPLRCSSNSPVKRQPLISVHNRSPNEGDDRAVSNSYGLRKPSLPTKIPSPASRSGIPVPSQFMDRAGSCTADDNWSQDSY